MYTQKPSFFKRDIKHYNSPNVWREFFASMLLFYVINQSRNFSTEKVRKVFKKPICSCWYVLLIFQNMRKWNDKIIFTMIEKELTCLLLKHL